MAIKERMSGNEAVAYAIRQVNPDVMPAFPITPFHRWYLHILQTERWIQSLSR